MQTCRPANARRFPVGRGSPEAGLRAASPAYAYVFPGGNGLLVKQTVSSVAGCSLRTAPHVAATPTATLALTGFRERSQIPCDAAGCKRPCTGYCLCTWASTAQVLRPRGRQ